MPDTKPEPAATVATDAVPLLQVPPAVASVSVVVVFEQIVMAPPMAAGEAFTPMLVVVLQPVGRV